MKPKCFLFLVLLGFSRLISLTVSSINESIVVNYVLERRSNDYDTFFVNIKNGTKCTNGEQLHEWCSSLGAYESKQLAPSSCSCKCDSNRPSFIPSLRECVNGSQLSTISEGCPNHIYLNLVGTDTYSGLNFAVDLQKKGEKITSVSSKGYKCCLFGYYFDYSGFQARWESVTDGIFNLRERQQKFSIQGEDKHNNLSGRIIKLNLTCINITQKKKPRKESCYLFKAVGNVTYYAPKNTSLVGVFPTTVIMSSPSPICSFSPSSQLSQTSSLSPIPRPTASPSPSHSLGATTRSSVAETDKFSAFVSTHIETRSLQTRPALCSSGPILPSTSKTELESFSPVNSEETSNQVTNTWIPTSSSSSSSSLSLSSSSSSSPSSSSSVSTGEPNHREPSELPTTELSLPTRDGPGDKEARASGKDKGVAIGAGLGGTVTFGIIVIGVIVIFCWRKKSRENTETKAKLDVGVKNPVHGKPQDDIEIERPREKAKTFSEQESQPTYMELVDKRGHENCGAVYSSLDENYDKSSVYQSLNKKTPAAEPPVYQSLKNNQPSTKKPIPKQRLSNVKKPEKPSVQPDPVYSVLEESYTKQGEMSEALYNVLERPVPGHDTLGNIQDPVYNVLDGPDAGRTYEDPDVGVQQDPLYNVLEVPESKQEHQEPVYNILESADTESACSRQEAPHDGAVSEPLYNVLDGADSGGANVSGAEYASPNRPLSGRDNPAYGQTLEFGVPKAVVHSPESQRESFYEPLEGSDRQDVYEPLQKKGK